jgi:multisubunit Na+/H+ antiporter MnhC subunit
MSGALILALVLLAFPIVVGLSTAALAAVLGFFLNKDAETRHQGSELLQLND